MTVLPFVQPSVRRRPSQRGPRNGATPSVTPPSPSLDPLFRSRSMGQILARLMANPEREWSRTDLHFATFISTSTVTTELRRAVEAGLVTERMQGRGPARFRVNTEHDLYSALSQVVLATYLPDALP